MEKRKPTKITVWKIIIIVLLSVSFVGAAGHFAIRKIDSSLFEERSNNIQILMGRITLSIEDSLEKEWNYLTYFKNDLQSDTPADREEAQKTMASLEQNASHNIKSLLLIDKSGYAYTSNGERFHWVAGRDYITDHKTCTIYTADLQDQGNESQMFFIMPFDTPLNIAGYEMTHIAMAVTMEFVDTFFSINEFGEHNAAFIMEPNGSQVYWQEANNPLNGVYNILAALKKAEFYQDASHEQLEDDIKARNKGCVGISYEGKDYYLAYEPLGVNDWISVVMVEQDSFSIGTRGFANSIISTLIVVALLTIFAIIIIITTAVHSANSRLRNAMAEEQQANEAKTRFLSSMSHDIRTPMNAIVGMAMLTREHIDDREYALDCLDKLEVSSHHLLSLINDVLDISKVESGDVSLNLSDFDLHTEAAHLANIIAPQAEEKGQSFEIRTEGLLPDNVRGDKLRVNQIMLNILSNAVKYTPNGGTVRAELMSELTAHDRIRLTYTVSDTGIGMSEEFQERMYDSFARENNEPQRRIQGTGLGLSICKQLVDLMDGTIRCVSAPGKGTAFTVTLEFERALTPVVEKPHEEAQDVYTDLEGTRILIAEDNDFNWEIAKEILAMYGIVTERAENGRIAAEMIESAEDGAYDLILMDIQMPELNGYMATERIRASQRAYLRSIPIVAMTADAFSEDIQRSMSVGMNDHVAKPIDIDELLKVIKIMKKLNQTEAI